MKIKAALFDADGVVIHPWRFAAYLEREHGITPAMTMPFFRGVFNQCLLGKADLKEAVAPFLRQWGWKKSVEYFIATWMQEEDAPDERMLGQIAALRANGTPCYLATNQEAYRVAYLRGPMHFGSLFDGVFASCELGALKHEALFYKHVGALLAIPPEAIAFWDDSAHNIEVAQACRWHAHLFTSYEIFKEQADHLLPI